jgi:hypothetical protein
VQFSPVVYVVDVGGTGTQMPQLGAVSRSVECLIAT